MVYPFVQLAPDQENLEIPLNLFIAYTEAYTLGVIDRALTIPPTNPSSKGFYIFQPTATGVAAGKEQQLAWYAPSGTWYFFEAQNGQMLTSRDDRAHLIYDSTLDAWELIFSQSSAGVAPTPESIRDSLQTLAGSDRLSVSAIDSSIIKELPVYASAFGAVGDGVTDDTAALQAALDFTGSLLQGQQDQGLSGKSILWVAGGTYSISSPLIIRNGTSLIGETKSPPYPNRISGFRSNDNLLTGTEIICSENFVGDYAIILEPDNTSVEDIILDGHSIPSGTTWTQINVRTTEGKYATTGFIELPVNDVDDKRIQGGLQFHNVEIPYFPLNQYSEFQLQAIGGDGDYNFFTSSVLPVGLTLSSSGLISGTPTEEGLKYPTFSLQDGTGDIVSRGYPLGVLANEIKTKLLLPPTLGTSYSFFLELYHSDTTNLTWEGIHFPDWLFLDSVTGELSAPSTTAIADVGFHDIKIQLKYNDEVIDTRAYTLELRYEDGGLRIFGDQIIKPQEGVAFSYTYFAHGGYGSYTWTINDVRSNAESGNATTVTTTSPFSGLTLNSATGEISGTPTTSGNNSYYLRCTSTVDTDFFYEALYYVWVEAPGVKPKFHTRSLPTASKGLPYSYQLSGDFAGGTLEAVNLPTGLSISETGLISGTPVGAQFTSGVRLQWSGNVKNCTIRGFRSGGGIISRGASNVHRVIGCLISVCDQGIYSVNQTWDSHFHECFIYNCRVGIGLGSGSAGLTFEHLRIEFCHQYGVQMESAHENDFSSCYLDTSGWSSFSIVNCRNTLINGCRLYRSGRLIRGPWSKFDSKANREYSNHIYMENCLSIAIVANSFNIGSNGEGSGLFMHDDELSENVRPYVGIRIKNVSSVNISGNSFNGSVNNIIDANLTTFGENKYKGNVFENNNQSDKQLIPRNFSPVKFYLPNACFQIWQRDVAFAIPPAGDNLVDTFAIADGWTLRRGGNSVIDQIVNVSRGTDAPVANGYYLHLDKPLNTTAAPDGNFQTLQLENIYGESLSLTSNRNIILSYYARSATSNAVKVKVSQYPDTTENGFAAYPVLSDVIVNPDTNWKRYQHYFELQDLAGLTFGENSLFNIVFIMDNWDEAIDLDITGVQIDFIDHSPYAEELRVGDFEEELAWAQLRYQKSKPYDLYIPSWSDGHRYDVNGSNWQAGYLAAYSPTTNGAQLTTTVFFDNPILEHPGYPDASGGILPNIKLLNPQHLTDQSDPNKYTWAGTGVPAPYIDQASRKGFKVSARNATTTADEGYAAHWLVTFYEQDLT